MQKRKKARKKIKLSAQDINNIMRRMTEITEDTSVQQNEVITLKEMAKFLKITPVTLKKYVLNNDIKGHFAANKKVYFLRSDFNESLFIQDGMLTCDEVAKKLKVNPRTVRRWISRGILVAQKIGKKWWINSDDYFDFLELGACNHG